MHRPWVALLVGAFLWPGCSIERAGRAESDASAGEPDGAALDAGGADAGLADAGPCVPDEPGEERTCDDGRDNDCDGAIDANDGACWWDPAWSRRTTATVMTTGVAEALVDVPVLLVLGPGALDHGVSSADGRDLRVVSGEDIVLSHEVETWTQDGPSYVWVRIPRLEPGAEVPLLLYHGHPEAPVLPASHSEGVWDAAHRAVWHLAEPVDDGGATGVHRDSTGRGNDGTQDGNAGVDDGAGAIGGAQAFDGIDDRIAVPRDGLPYDAAAVTIEVRAMPQRVEDEGPFPHFWGAGAGGDGRYWQLWWEPGNGRIAGRYRIDGAQRDVGADPPAGGETAGRFWYLAMVWDGDAVRLYLDGDEAFVNAVTGALDPFTTDFLIGDNPVLEPREFAGQIDEMRISATARGADWIAVQQRSLTGELVTIGTVEAVPGR